LLLGLPYFADRNGISAAPHPTIISSYENTQDSSRNHEPLNSFPIGGSPLYMLGTSDGVLNNNYAMDDLTTLTRKYGVFPFIRKNARPSIGFDGETANMCFYNYRLSHLNDQHLTGHLPQLTDVPMILPPKKNVTLVLDIDGKLLQIFFLLWFCFLALEIDDMLIFCLPRNPDPLINER
jgi:hypothetical protein